MDQMLHLVLKFDGLNHFKEETNKDTDTTCLHVL